MKLYLVQHGKAATKEENPQRPLTEEGRKDVKKTALFLRQSNIRANNIFHSTKERARETAFILAQILNPKCRLIQKDKLAPNDSIDNIHGEILESTEDSMIVGHLPFLAKLASKLLLNTEDKNIIEFEQGSAVLLEKTESTWKLKWFITPGILGK